jgi:hypothetical protein
MAILNSYQFVHTVIDWEKFAQATKNQYRVVTSRPYSDKKGILPNGYTVTLMVMKDDFDYGVDKNGNARESNLYNTFDVTVLSRHTPLKKGDVISLVDFVQEHSYALNFDLILRFKDYKILQPQDTKKA